jgi:hypothetical protein
MKNFASLFFVLLLTVSCSLVSCLEELEKTDKIASSTFKPAVEFPLINSDFDMQEFLTEGNSKANISENNGMMVITYKDSISTPSGETFFSLPNQQSPDLSISGPEVSFPSPGGSFTVTKNLTFNFNTLKGEVLDSILVKAGQIALQVNSTFPANINLQVSVASLEVSNSPYIQNIVLNGAGNRNVSTNLQGSVFDLTRNGTTANTISFAITATITDTGQPINSSHNLTCSFTLNGLRFRALFGDLGSHSFPFSADSIDVDVFDNAFNGTLELLSPAIHLDLENSFGIPIGFNIREFAAIKNSNSIPLSGTALNAPTNPYRLNAPPASQAGQSVTTQISLTPTNSNLPQLISSLPNYLSYWFGLTLNPAPTESKNFVLDDSKLKMGVTVELPFHGRMSALTITKRFDFDGLGIDDVEQSFIKLRTVNELPLDASIQAYFVDASGATLDSLFTDPSIIKGGAVDANGFAQSSTEVVNEISVTQQKVDRIEQAETLVLKVVVSTTNNGSVPVKFSATDKIKISLGVNTRLEYKLN